MSAQRGEGGFCRCHRANPCRAQRRDSERPALSPTVASALLALGMSTTRDEAVTWAGIAVLRGCTAEMAHDCYEQWARSQAVQTLRIEVAG